MASIIKGYEYDIFISYRQKDNKYDGWVTEFVSNLRKELEATLKEEISIYYDLNPYDGILSSYDIDQSLQAKLKCLIIIPVLSHTYCDTGSYAWQFEFCAFNQLAEKDAYGKTIKLRNGNVVSRILPVKIHHLDNADLQLIQKETGSLPRTIDFIYEEPGVNRPLMPGDHKRENLNKTDYRNQINKLANVISDVLASMKNEKPETPASPEPCSTCTINDEHIGIKSIAVLPFINLSKDPEQEYFGEGIAEEIINSLVPLEDLKVAGHISSSQFKGDIDFREVGIKLSVCHVVVGSVRIFNKRLRVTAQLISVEDGFNLWSEKYDRELNDIFRIQDEIACAITEKLKTTLFKKSTNRISRTYTKHHDVYELYLRGKFYSNKRGMYILKGAEYFQKAIDLDSEFALAHAGLADCYSLMASYGLVPPRTVMHKIKEAAETAIRLDDSICEPYCSMGFYYVSIEHNWKEAKKNFLQSLELNPNYAQAHYWYGWNYLAWIEGNFEEARKHGKLAISLEPLSSICYAIYSRILLDCANYQEALEASQKGLELEPNAYLCQLNEGNSYLFLNQYEQAESAFEVALKISQRHHYAINGLIWAYCKLGKRREAKALYKELKERSKSEYVGQTFTAISAAYLGELGEAIECLEKAYDDLDPVIVTVKNSNWFPNNLTQEERFQNLVHKIYPETNVFSDNLTGLS